MKAVCSLGLPLISIFLAFNTASALTLEMLRTDNLSMRESFVEQFEEAGGDGITVLISDQLVQVTNDSRDSGGLLYHRIDDPFQQSFYFEASGFFQAEFHPDQGDIGVLAPGVFGDNYAAWYIGRESGRNNEITAGIISGAANGSTPAYFGSPIMLDGSEHAFSIFYDFGTDSVDFGIDGQIVYENIARDMLYSDPGREASGIYLPGSVSTNFIGTGFYTSVFYTDDPNRLPGANPEPVPEPGTLVLLSMGALGLLKQRSGERN